MTKLLTILKLTKLLRLKTWKLFPVSFYALYEIVINNFDIIESALKADKTEGYIELAVILLTSFVATHKEDSKKK